jgi:hypothetical protein
MQLIMKMLIELSSTGRLYGCQQYNRGLRPHWSDGVVECWNDGLK